MLILVIVQFICWVAPPQVLIKCCVNLYYCIICWSYYVLLNKVCQVVLEGDPNEAENKIQAPQNCAEVQHLIKCTSLFSAAAFNSIMPCFRVPLHKTRSMRRLMSDNGMSLEELRALAKSKGAVDSSPSPKLPVERLTNFMDVCG